MTAVIDQEACMTLITGWIGNLTSNVDKHDRRKMEKIAEIWGQGVSEIQGDGLTPETCEKMSKHMIAAEEHAKRVILAGTRDIKHLHMYEGLKVIHSQMTLLLASLGGEANEGNKDCCPLACSGC